MRCRLGVAFLATVLVACGGPDPVSTGVPVGDASAVTAAPADEPSADEPVASDPADTERADDETADTGPLEIAAPGATDPPAESAAVATDPPTTTDEVAGTDQVGGGDDFATPDDEPSFEVEPLQPFVEVDELPTGWAAFDFNLSDSLLRNGNTAASVAVSIDGEVVHRAAMGARTPRAGDSAEPVDRFRIASISKTLTAIALLQLVENGVVGLDEPVGERVAAHVGVTDPSARTRAVTPRRLLNHTAGYGKFQSVFFGGQAADCAEAARIGLGRSPAGGGSYNYSNMGYCIAGQLIEALTGRDYDDVVYAEVLAPLGISGPRLADTFDPGPDEILHPSTLGRNYMEALGPAGGWIATPEDLVTVLDSLDPTSPGYKPLEPETLEMMKTPVGGRRGQRGYGLGLLLYGGERYGHTGTIEATHAMVMNRGDGVTWAITVSGPYPDDTPRLESIINRAFIAGGFVAG